MRLRRCSDELIVVDGGEFVTLRCDRRSEHRGFHAATLGGGYVHTRDFMWRR